MILQFRGGSRIFSRGGADFKKKFENFDDLFFFRSTKFIFRALPKHCFAPFLAQNFLRRRQIFEKTVKKAVFGHFLKNFDKKIAFFFGARSPSKLVYVGAKGAFRKILGSVGQKWISEKVSKGGPFGSAGGRIPKGKGVRPPPPAPSPLNPPLLQFKSYESHSMTPLPLHCKRGDSVLCTKFA